MNTSSEKNLIYLGTIEHYNKNLNLIKLKDIAEGYKIKDECLEIYTGFSRNFIEKLIIKNFEIGNNKIVIYLNENTDFENNNLINKAVFVDDKFIENTKPNFYLVGDLIDCKVIDIDTGNFIGTITDVSILPGNDVWFVSTESGEMPVPVINDVIKKVEISEKCVYIKLLDGLIDLIASKKDEK
jgi:ribosomal 30S subunit maturation factor RimM